MIGKLSERLGFMRDHRWTSAHFSDYIDHELDAAERARLEHHARLCPKCHRMLETLKKTIEGLRGLSTAPQPQIDLAGSVIERLRNQP